LFLTWNQERCTGKHARSDGVPLAFDRPHFLPGERIASAELAGPLEQGEPMVRRLARNRNRRCPVHFARAILSPAILACLEIDADSERCILALAVNNDRRTNDQRRRGQPSSVGCAGILLVKRAYPLQIAVEVHTDQIICAEESDEILAVACR